MDSQLSLDSIPDGVDVTLASHETPAHPQTVQYAIRTNDGAEPSFLVEGSRSRGSAAGVGRLWAPNARVEGVQLFLNRSDAQAALDAEFTQDFERREVEVVEIAVEGSPAAKPATALDADGCAWIPESKYDALAAKTTKLNRRAAKLGCTPIGVQVIGERFIPIKDPHTDIITRSRREVHVQVTGAAPAVAGWTFVARVQHSEGGNIVAKAPSERGAALDEQLWVAEPVCEHCHLARRRHDTFILRGADGAVKQVGRNCLADFLRSEDVEAALAFWKYLYEVETSLGAGGDDEDERGWGGGSGRHYFDLPVLLKAAAIAIRVEGWMSRSAAREGVTGNGATADTVGFILNPPWSRDERANNEIKAKLVRYESTEADAKVAADTLEWTRRRLDPQSDYERNLKVACTPDHVEPRNLGLAVSAVQAWLRLTAKREQVREPVLPASEHLGEVGKRLRKVPCTVTGSKLREDPDTGWVSALLTFVDEGGHVLKWFATGDRQETIGARVLVTGTVKRHGEWHGAKETLLSRCVVEDATPTVASVKEV